MSQTCTHCARVNPHDAHYCYFDGSALQGANGTTSAQVIGTQPFPTPFTFPNGHSCRNFDQLAVGCQQHWESALAVLQQGGLEQFLGGLGRADLAAAAKAAAAFPDRERGLDQLLAKLPTQALQAPKLRLERQEIDLGTVQRGKPIRFDLQLVNQGGRLLYGSVVATCNWLRLGDGPGAGQKLFQFGGQGVVVVQVVAEQLRAGPNGMEGQLVIESNGGSVTVTVRTQGPVVPFAQGVLTGATTPRQIAEKAKAAPKEAAVFFENGAVQQWYQANGWTYPVQGPSASGLGAVQQFFEALGLAKAPRVEITEKAVQLHGQPGEKVRHTLQVRSVEKRPVFAHARSDQPWLVVGLTQLNGATALIPLEVQPVPNKPGEVLQGHVTITANGNQKFVVPVTLTVGAATGIRPAAVAWSGDQATTGAALTPTVAVSHGDTDLADRKPRELKGRPAAAAAVAWSEDRATRGERARPRLQDDEGDGENTGRKLLLIGGGVLLLLLLVGGLFVMVGGLGGPESKGKDVVAVEEEKAEKIKGAAKKPLVIIEDENEEGLRIDLAKGVVARVVEEKDEGPPATKPKIEVVIKDEPGEEPAAVADFPVNPDPLVRYLRGAAEYGITALRDRRNQPLNKRITYSANGQTNRTMLHLKNVPVALNTQQVGAVENQLPDDVNRQAFFRSERVYQIGQITLRHILEVVASKQPAEVGGQRMRLLDTVLCRYVFENNDTKAQRVGMRTQVDTLIGSNDGVPFTIPGVAGLVSTSADFRSPAQQIPPFIQALERGDLRNPGTIALMTIKVGGGVEPPGRLSLTYWPADHGQYLVPVEDIRRDSCVVLYWPEKLLPAKGRREVGYAYGLGAVDAGEAAGKLGITLNGNFEPGQVFTVTALITNPVANQMATLEVPPGLAIDGQGTLKVPPPAGQNTSVLTWNVKVEKPGEFRISVSSRGAKQSKTISIIQKEGQNFGKLDMKLTGTFEKGEFFDVAVTATDPQPGQTLTLKLPPGLELREAGKDTKAVPPVEAGKNTSTVKWEVRVNDYGDHKIRAESSTGAAKTSTLTVQKQDNTGRFTLKLDGPFQPGKIFTVKARVAKPALNQTLTMELPKQLVLAAGSQAEQAVPAASDGSSEVTWKVKLAGVGKLPIKVRSSTGLTKVSTLNLEHGGGDFVLELAGDIGPGKEFKVIAKVTNPVPDQKLTLLVPAQLKLVEGTAAQLLPAEKGIHRLEWRVRVVQRGSIPVWVESTTGIKKGKTIKITDGEGSSGSGNIFGK